MFDVYYNHSFVACKLNVDVNVNVNGWMKCSLTEIEIRCSASLSSSSVCPECKSSYKFCGCSYAIVLFFELKYKFFGCLHWLFTSVVKYFLRLFAVCYSGTIFMNEKLVFVDNVKS